MPYSLEEIAATLKSARQEKQITQRELSERVGLTQSHISKIENAAVDLQLSSLSELARALELELVLVPRKALPAVQSLIRTSVEPQSPALARSNPQARALRRLKKSAQKVQKLQPNLEAPRVMQRLANDMTHKTLPPDLLDNVMKIATRVAKFSKQGESVKPYTLDSVTTDSIQELNDELSRIINIVAQAANSPEAVQDSPRPAYQLPEDEDDG